jgi:hypothetical protein
MLDVYWRFAAERQRIFHARAAGSPPPWTDDPILTSFRFTNAYRAADRVSQYLINVVLPGSDRDPMDVVLRALLFKVFNRVSTWEYLESQVGAIHISTFSATRYAEVLDRRLDGRQQLYSAAYIMPMPHTVDASARKHSAHLALIERVLWDGLSSRLVTARSLKGVYEILRSIPSFGPFLAFQYAIDLNYSWIIDFDEMEFVVAGPGAVSGIEKCFIDMADWDYADVIRWTTEHANCAFERLGIQFIDLWGRPLQLIDCQNLFCEVDKYTRVAFPAAGPTNGRRRIKQRYRPDPTPLTYRYPAKWGITPRLSRRA